VVINATEDGARQFENDFNLPYPSGMDRAGKITSTYKVTGVPETFFIDSEGNIIEHWIGGLNDATLAKFLNQLK